MWTSWRNHHDHHLVHPNQPLEDGALTPYSPHLNPDEQVWNHLKNHTLGKRGFRLVGALKRMASEHMELMRKAGKLIRSFFEEPHCRYARLSPQEELPLPP